jgi:hypothetical protein
MRKNSGGVLGELLRRRNVLLAESHERQVAALDSEIAAARSAEAAAAEAERQAEYRGAGDG